MAVTVDHNPIVLLYFSECFCKHAFVLYLQIPESRVGVTVPSCNWTVGVSQRLAGPPFSILTEPSHLSVQRVFRAPVHPHPTCRAGDQPCLVAACRESIQSPGYILLLLSDGTVYQGAGLADRIPQGKQPSECLGDTCQHPGKAPVSEGVE